MWFARNRAPPAGPRTSDGIASEADLLSFRRGDPFCLPSSLHGDARFGFVQHIWRADMYAATAGSDVHVAGYPLAFQRFSDGSGRNLAAYVVWPHEGHRLIVGAPGSGKFTCGIAPLLLDDDDCNAFVLDPKGGEGFRNSWRYREQLCGDGAGGVRILDPCALFPAMAPESINPLDIVNVENANIVGDVDKLVDALVVTSGHEREPIWAMSAKKVLRGVITHLCTYPSARRSGPAATLMDVQHAISEGISEALLEEMADNPVVDGLVVRSALEIAELKVAEGTWRGVKFQIDASLAFLDNPGVRRSLAATSFDLSDLRRKRLSLYVVLPNKEKEALGRWLRLIYTTVIDRIDNITGARVHVVVDEFAALGKFDRIVTDLATQRSAGLRYHLAVQDLNQLNELYGHQWQTIVGNCSVRQFLGVNDNFTAEYVSRALGMTTKHDGDDIQHDYPDAPPKRRPRFVGRELMTPAEVLAMPQNVMVIFADRCARPLRLIKSPYFEHPKWAARAALAP